MSLPELAQLKAVRAMFASIYDADRLRELPLVHEIAAAAGCDLAAPELAETVRRRIDEAIDSLDSRARAIIVRCDLGQETNLAVASDLGIGERYFYRERRRALLELAATVANPLSAHPGATPSEPLDALMSAAASLRSAGRSRDGIGLLAGAYERESSARLRIALALQVAHFAAGSDDFAQVAKWIERGRLHLAQIAGSPDESSVLACELDLVEIRADVARGGYERAQQRARSVARTLTALPRHRHSERIGAALADTYVFLAETQIMRGAYSDGLALALEGHASLQRMSIFAQVANVETLVAVAYARFFASTSVARIIEDLNVAYSRAVALGLGRHVTKIAAGLSLVYALRGEHERSAGFGNVVSIVGRHMLSPSERVDTSIDLIAAALRRGDAVGARAAVTAAAPHARGLLASVLRIANAEIEFASGEPRRALAMIQRAASEIKETGNLRFLGSARRIEAEALAAVGQRSAAAHRITDAIDCLEKAGNPISLSRAYSLSAKVTGNRRHRASARELSAHAKVV